MLLVVRREAAGGYAAEYYLIDNSPHPRVLTATEFKDGVFTFMDGPRRYRGVMSADGDRIEGIPFNFQRSPERDGWVVPRPVAHTVQMVTVDNGVKLEVVDWGGSGPPLVFLAGTGEDAHVFDFFAPRFTAKHRVYGITRRGFGASDKPDPNYASYSATRLGNDVLEIMAQLKINKPTLVGWSMGGAELSSIATRLPDKVAGVVYLESYAYAFYAPGTTLRPDVNILVDVNEMRDLVRKAIAPGKAAADTAKELEEVLAQYLTEFKADLESARDYYRSLPPATGAQPARATSLDERIDRALAESVEKFTGVKVPVLAFFATLQLPPAGTSDAQRERALLRIAEAKEYIAAFERAHPQGRVFQLANSQHAIFSSNADEVFREMEKFLDELAH